MNYNLLTKRRRRTCSELCQQLHIDPILFIGLLVINITSLLIIYSASNQNLTLLGHQIVNSGFAFLTMMILAQIPISRYSFLVPWIFGITLLMLFIVINVGIVSRGAQRWIDLWWFRVQPSEIMKLAVSMILSWYLRNKTFPLQLKDLSFSCLIILIPVLIIAKQPDLGTALLVAATGCFVILLAGITWEITLGIGISIITTLPIIWNAMHSYQKMRLLTFLSPEKDPLGSGYNIIQSKIAIGNGGWFGKGWLHGSQTHLQFLPERSTDFIFAVYGEEFGFIGCILLISLFVFIIWRSLYISVNAQDTFTRLLTGSLTLSFFTSFFVNIGMVTGILPIVGIPLPLLSYGGSSLIIFMASFGIIMSVRTHHKLIGN